MAKPVTWMKNKVMAVGEMMRITAGTHSRYILDSDRVDYERARKLYRNEEDKYKLGAAFVKPVINSSIGFMGVPSFSIEGEDAQQLLDDFMLENTSKMMMTHLEALKLGDCYVWITRENDTNPLYPEVDKRLVYTIIPPEMVKDIHLDPTTGEPLAYILESKSEWEELSGTKRSCIITQKITANERIVEITGDTPPGMQAGTDVHNKGYIPIVHFKNEPETTLKYGQSDIGPIEPYLKAYNDVMLHAMKGSKMHSTPKLKMKLKDVPQFLLYNLGIEDPAKFAREGGTINLDGQEILFLNEEEDAEFVEVKSATGDAKVLLKLLFYCIVDISETPEFIFGVHTPSALASVKEQMPIMINKIKRKREQFTEQWQQLARIVLAIESEARGQGFSSHAVNINWDEIDPRDEKELASALESITKSLKIALEAGIISEEAAVEYLSQYIDTMNSYITNDPEIPGERERIIRTRRLRNRLGDNDGWLDEILDIDKNLIGDDEDEE